MTAKRDRKSLSDAELGFLDGTAPLRNEPIDEKPAETVEPEKKAKPASKTKTTSPNTQKKRSIMSQLLEATTEKEATIRLTVDMPKSMHQKLTMFCARTGKKKADVVRLLLDEALQELEE